MVTGAANLKGAWDGPGAPPAKFVVLVNLSFKELGTGSGSRDAVRQSSRYVVFEFVACKTRLNKDSATEDQPCIHVCRRSRVKARASLTVLSVPPSAARGTSSRSRIVRAEQANRGLRHSTSRSRQRSLEVIWLSESSVWLKITAREAKGPRMLWIICSDHARYSS